MPNQNQQTKINQKSKEFKSWEKLPPYIKEALEMNAHKTARILNGDFLYSDSYHDIIGYTKLVEDELTKWLLYKAKPRQKWRGFLICTLARLLCRELLSAPSLIARHKAARYRHEFYWMPWHALLIKIKTVDIAIQAPTIAMIEVWAIIIRCRPLLCAASVSDGVLMCS